MTSQPLMMGSGLNITNADFRYQQNSTMFNDVIAHPYNDAPPQHHRVQNLRRPKSTGELSTGSNRKGYGSSQYGGGNDEDYYNMDGQPPYQVQRKPHSPYDAANNEPYQYQQDNANSRNEFPMYPLTYNPYHNRLENTQTPPQDTWHHREPTQNPNPHYGRYSQVAPLPWKMTNQPTSPDVRRTIGQGIAVPGFRSQPGTPYIPIVENDSVRTNGSGVFPPRVGGPRKRALSEGEVQLNRQGTLLTPHATDKRASAELGIMLGSGRQRLQKDRLLPQGELPIEEKLARLDQVKLEAKKGRKARVEVDVILESDVMVEGGELRGRLELRIRKSRKGESLWIGAGKVRVCGYEEHSHTSSRHIFYHYPHQLPLFSPYDDSQHPLFASPPNEEGFRLAREGFHVIPFSVRLPMKGGAKGGWVGSPSTGVKYVVVGSIKLHTPETKKRSIAHFYRPCTIYPYVSPQLIFGSTEHPTEVRTEQGLGWSLTGEKGKVRVIAELPRPDWVAGQNVWIKIFADNQSQKKIRTLNVALLEQVILFKPPGSKRGQEVTSADLSRYSAIPIRRKICEETVEASPGAGSGYVGASGWWTGVQPGERSRWQASLMLPSKLLSIRRSRLVEVSYIIRLTLNNTITLDVPLNIINFLSIDPPPSINVSTPSTDMTATDSRRMEMAVDSSVRSNEDFGGKQGRYSANSEDNRMEILISEKSSSRASKTRSQIFYPKDRQRPESIYREDERTTPRGSPRVMPEPPAPFNKPRPSSMSSLPSESIAHSLRPPFSKRDTTASYYSAVASLAEDEDLKHVETRRRLGRHLSLAALTGTADGDQKDSLGQAEEEYDELDGSRVMTPPAGTYAPSVSLTNTIEDSAHQELEEAERDLEFVQRASADHQQASSVGHHSLFERDSESRFLEDELTGESNYRKRYHECGSDDSHGTCVDCHERLSQSSESVHTRESASQLIGNNSSDGDMSTTQPGSIKPSAKMMAALPNTMTHQESDQVSPADGSEQHLLATRSAYGSIAASATSSISGAETEIGQVVQAIRRDLSIRQSPLSGKEALELRLRQARSLEPHTDNGALRTPVRSNSLAPPLLIPPQPFNRRPSAPASWSRKGTLSSSPINSGSRANSTPVETVVEHNDVADCEERPSNIDPDIEARPSSSPQSAIAAQLQPDVSSVAAEPSTIPTPVEGISETPGLAPSIAGDSASSQEGSRASTPAQDLVYGDDDKDLQVVEEIPEPMSPTEHALEKLMMEADETMASLGLDSISRKTMSARYSFNSDLSSGNRLRDKATAPRSPAGPRHRESFTSSAPGSPLSQYSQSVGHGQEIHRSPEPTPVKEQTTPTRRSHTAILGGARNRISNRTSGTSHTTDYLTHSPGSSVASQHMIMTPGRNYTREFEGQYSLDDIPEIRSMASDPSLRKKGADRNSIASISTTATSSEKMLLERKSSGHVFPYSKQMTGYTNQQLQPMNSVSDDF